ncbi:MAG: substrate-binding domain-containing protein [Candidatus Puniceispirillaceae bacterium]
MRFTPLFVGVIVSLALSTVAQARDQISIVGSSTVYPFATIVAEKFGQTSGFKTPVIESTGTGGGMKLFCKGVGVEYPDVTNASRAMKSKEAKMCADAGVEFQEFVVGNDGIAFSNSLQGQAFYISIAHIAAALAAELPFQTDGASDATPNKLKTWADVDAYTAKRISGELTGLPNIPVSVMVPPPTSGTRDAMGALFMKNGWKKLGLEGGGYKKLREDGVAIEVGENDSLIIEKLVADKNMFGVFGYSFFDQNRDKVQASVLDGVVLDFENIASYKYPGARPLFFYVKKAHMGVIPGMKMFIDEFVSEKAMGLDGYLFPAGLVPLSEDDFAKQVAARDAL